MGCIFRSHYPKLSSCHLLPGNKRSSFTLQKLRMCRGVESSSGEFPPGISWSDVYKLFSNSWKWMILTCTLRRADYEQKERKTWLYPNNEFIEFQYPPPPHFKNQMPNTSTLELIWWWLQALIDCQSCSGLYMGVIWLLAAITAPIFYSLRK